MKNLKPTPNYYIHALCIVSAAVVILPGIILIVSPQTVMGIYGFQLDAAGAFAGRMQGVLLVGFAVVYWFARNATAQPLRFGVLVAGLLTNAITTVIVILSLFTGTINAAGWPAVALHGALTIGFIYALYLDRQSL